MFAPNVQMPLHHTDTLDFDIVLAGTVELVLGDGAHRLGPGDSVVVTAVDHSWSTGPEGCTLSIVTVGTPPPK
jgi:quercetin dioxygenase-like cupin family protein